MFTKITELCTKNNISVTQLERELGFGRCTIAKWKVSSPTVGNLKKVADHFGVPITYLLENNTTRSVP